MEKLKNYLRDLTNISGVSSREDEVIKYMYKAFSKYSNNVTIDNLGNTICHFPSPKKNARKVMIFGHTDEVGLIVRYIDEKGFIRFERVGGANLNVLPGSKVDLMGEKGLVTGLVGTKSYHFLTAGERGQIPHKDNLYIDIGAFSREEVEERGIKVGCFASYHSEFLELGGTLVCNKSMDNRIACSILLLLAEDLYNLEKPLEWDVYLIACVQEEFNIRGILPAVRRIQPDASIGVDVTPSCDTPDLNHYAAVCIDKGPALTYMNSHGRGTLAGTLPDKRLMDQLEKVSNEEKIPYQREVAVGVITENGYILFEELGVPVANIAIPTRYTHTPIEVVSLKDLDLGEKLIFAFLKSLREDTTFGKSFMNENQ